VTQAGPHERKSISADIERRILGDILSGKLKPGLHLPTERQMAEDFGVSRASVHQAILDLESQGFVSILPRHGIVVKDFRKYPTPQSLEALMSNSSMELDRSIFNDMMDTRLWLESECARRACTRITPEIMQEMEQTVEEMLKPGVDLERLTDQVFHFHYLLTQASGNSVYSMIFRGFESVLHTMIRYHYRVKSEDIVSSAATCKELLGYIRRKDENAASDCVCRIIRQGIMVLEEQY